MNSITDFGEATMASVSLAMASLFAAIPRILAFALILLIGWFVASLIAKAVASVLRAVKFNELAARAGFTGFVQKMGVGTDASGFLALIAKWFVRLIVLVVAFDALGLPAVSDVLRQMLLWLPNLVVAMVVLVVGGLAADALGKVVRAATAQGGFTNPDLLGKIAKVAIWAFSIIVAVNQLGIATTLVNTMVMATFGAVALALGLAFGLGGRDTAAELVAGWRQAAQDAEPKLKAAAEGVQNTSTLGAASPIGVAQSVPPKTRLE